MSASIDAGRAVAQPPLVIAHRGASGYRPEHTLEAYRLAIQMGAGAIEPDLVSTKDGILIARHENDIGGTTDVSAKFPERKTTKTIDGASVTGWFTEDLTLAEIRTLRAKERLAFRAHEFDGRSSIPTFEEVLTLVEQQSRSMGRTIAVYPETKHPTYFRSIGLPLEEKLTEQLAAHQMAMKASPVFIQSFEPESLRRMRSLTNARLVQLTASATDVTPEQLATIATYADGVGVEKKLLVPEDAERVVLPATSVVGDAHHAGLFVHVWTLRREAEFLSPSYRGDFRAEIRRFVELGVDGLFTDFPDVVADVIAGGGSDAR